MKQLDFRRFLKLFKYAFFDAVMITVSYLIAIFMFMVLELPLDQYALSLNY
jgi:hypothetical protein